MPEIDKCSMLPLKFYYVKIISSDGGVILERNVTETTAVFQHLDYSPRITFIVNITVVDSTEQRSNSTITMKTIGMYISSYPLLITTSAACIVNLSCSYNSNKLATLMCGFP